MFLGTLVQVFAQSRQQDAARRHELAFAGNRDRRERRDRTIARIRELYLEVLDIALAATPEQLGYRLPSKKAITIGEWEDAAQSLVNRANAVRSRLTLETDAKVDEVLTALVAVLNNSALYEAEAAEERQHPERYPPGEIAKLRDQIRDAYLRLGARCREHLEALEGSHGV